MKFGDAGLRDGSYKAWHKNGKKLANGKYTQGVQQGCWETWHGNGQEASKGTYADGKKVKTWLYWTPAGVKRKEKLGGQATGGECMITC